MAPTSSGFNISAAGPASGTALAQAGPGSTPPLIPGHEYAITVAAYYTGTVAAADQDNAGVYVDGNLIGILLLPAVAETAAADPNPQRFNAVTTTGSIQIRVIATGSGTQVFHTSIVCEDVGTGVSSI